MDGATSDEPRSGPVPARRDERGLRGAGAPAVLAGWIVLAMVTPPPAAAQQREPPPEAVKFYERAREHYEHGRYPEAVEDLERALTLDPNSPTLVYNLARVHELLGELDTAIEYYERYVGLLPEDEKPERKRIRETLRRLRGAREQLGEEEQKRTANPPADARKKQRFGARYITSHGVADWKFWLTLGGGVAMAATGAALGGLALARQDDANSFVVGRDGTHRDRRGLYDSAQKLALSADLLLAAGGLAALGAGLLYLLREHTEEVLPSEVAAGIGSDGTGTVLSVGGRL